MTTVLIETHRRGDSTGAFYRRRRFDIDSETTDMLRHAPLTLARAASYNDRAFPRCKSFIMNKFGARSLPPRPGCSVGAPARFTCRSAPTTDRDTPRVPSSGGGEEVSNG